MEQEEWELNDNQWIAATTLPPFSRILAILTDGSVAIRRPDGTGVFIDREGVKTEIDENGAIVKDCDG